jgi:hypothetical protein
MGKNNQNNYDTILTSEACKEVKKDKKTREKMYLMKFSPKNGNLQEKI